ncbi:hypothetical protein AQUSIP_23060 [Aquicella siphonis]|uniref:DUF4136 domain-containing protein n=1 Tax=Aquicella siphonis TaxID=254247 RepID=A0A5E4PIT6_9COXI|nr:hypothetical protein [Aquicella siphonis]VVC76979.1 hypothetical protein AQUSIP_23060 [Aquicella siphonis]
MNKLRIRFLCCLSILFMIMGHAYAAQSKTPQLVTADKVIRNLNQVIEQVKKQSQLSVMFPTSIPKGEQPTLYAMQSSLYDKPDYNQFWEITVASTPDCQMHGCVVGSLSVNTKGKLEKEYSQPPFGQNNKPLPKQEVKLENGLTGYFTPGHAEADWHAPALEWQMNGVLYTLSWDMPGDAKMVLVKMANSALKSQGVHQ